MPRGKSNHRHADFQFSDGGIPLLPTLTRNFPNLLLLLNSCVPGGARDDLVYPQRSVPWWYHEHCIGAGALLGADNRTADKPLTSA